MTLSMGIFFPVLLLKKRAAVVWTEPRGSCHAPQLSLLELVAHAEKESSCRSGADTTTLILKSKTYPFLSLLNVIFFGLLN